MGSNRAYVQRGPKRRIEKVHARINHTIISSQTTTDLHTVEDSKTLVRMTVQGMTMLSTNEGNFEIVIAVAPNGTTVSDCSASVNENLDRDDSKYALFRRIGMVHSGQITNDYFEFDSKAMRKLNPGDKIIMLDDADAADCAHIRAEVHMWFKE